MRRGAVGLGAVRLSAVGLGAVALGALSVLIGSPAPADAHVGGTPAVARRQGTTTYIEPVQAPVVDRFRPPSSPYGAGNRGWEYATSPGGAVRASGAGTVSFAGAVGGAVAVTLTHADGLRTSYTYLDTASVHAGDPVRQGDLIGRSGARLHFGVRRGDVYLDPAILFAPAGARRVRLVPLPPP